MRGMAWAVDCCFPCPTYRSQKQCVCVSALRLWRHQNPDIFTLSSVTLSMVRFYLKYAPSGEKWRGLVFALLLIPIQWKITHGTVNTVLESPFKVRRLGVASVMVHAHGPSLLIKWDGSLLFMSSSDVTITLLKIWWRLQGCTTIDQRLMSHKSSCWSRTS